MSDSDYGNNEIPAWYPFGVLFIVACQAAFIAGTGAISESNGEVSITWAVPLSQVREAIAFAVVFGTLLYYGIPWLAVKLDSASEGQ